MRWPILIALFSLSGCGTDGGLSAARLNPLNLLPAGLFDAALPESDEEPDGPYVRLTQGRRGSDARLIAQQGDRRMWRTRGGVVVATEGARVIATAGLPTMVAATRFDGPDPIATPQTLASRGADARRVVDLMTASRDPAAMRFGIALNCRLASAESAEPETLIITETCRAEGIGIIRNRFWMDRDTGTIQTSEQWIGPGARPLRIDHDLQPTATPPEAAPTEEVAQPGRNSRSTIAARMPAP